MGSFLETEIDPFLPASMLIFVNYHNYPIMYHAVCNLKSQISQLRS